MKNRKSDILTCVLFCGFLFAMLALFLALPRQSFSEKEKRYLAETPKLTWKNLTTGKYGEDVESWLADHIPGRDFLVGFNAYVDKLTGRQVTKDIYVAEGDRLVEAPGVWDQQTVEKNMNAINGFVEKIRQPVDLMIVPSAGFCLDDTIRGLSDPYRDTQMIRDIYAMADSNIRAIDLIPTFTEVQDPASLFYRTDHHWTSRGAYAAYKAYMELKGHSALAPEDFTVTAYDGFYGSTYSRSGLWLTESEPIELWDSGVEFTVTNNDSQKVSSSVFYPERLEELDKYTVFLDGNHSLVRIQNPQGSGKLLVIRDSYSNCLGGFLAESYGEVVLVDLRHYREAVSALAQQEDFDNILVCYSCANFLTDTNLMLLR